MDTTPQAAGARNRGWYLALGVALLLLAFRIQATPYGLWVDLDVYIAGGNALLDGMPLYDVRVADLPFTYPPFAAVLFTPLTMLPFGVARLLVSLISLICLALVARIVGRQVGLGALPIAVVLVVVLGAEPVVRTITLGQINIVLMLMVVLDLFVVPTRWRGLLTGVATGIKLVPGAFVLLFFLRRDLPAVGRAGIAFAATVLIGLVQPAAARSFWSGGMFDLGVGDTVVRADNQSLAGIVLRLASREDLPMWWQMVLTLGMLAIGVACAARVAGHPCAAPMQMAIMSVAALLASPVSWTHHWVWIVPIALVLVALRHWVLLAVTAVVFWIGVVWLGVPGDEQAALTAIDQALGCLYVAVGLATMLVLTRDGSAHESDPKITLAGAARRRA